MGIDHLAGMRHGWMIRLRPFSTRGRCRNACLFQKGCQYEHLSGLALQQVRTPAWHGDNLQAKKNPAKGRVFGFSMGVLPSFHSEKKLSSQTHCALQLAQCQYSPTLSWLSQNWFHNACTLDPTRRHIMLRSNLRPKRVDKKWLRAHSSPAAQPHSWFQWKARPQCVHNDQWWFGEDHQAN